MYRKRKDIFASLAIQGMESFKKRRFREKGYYKTIANHVN